MIRTGAIGPDHRANLRHLRASFEAAFDALDDATDRTSPAFIEAESHYKAWIKAIDGVALALLDDLDTWEALNAAGGTKASSLAPTTATSAAAPDLPDLAALFGGAPDFLRTRELLGASDVDQEEERLYEGP